MSKKQEMVNELTARVKAAGVLPGRDVKGDTAGYEPLMGSDEFWNRFPEGYCNAGGSVMECLSLLTEQDLSNILRSGEIVSGINIYAQIRKWKQKGLCHSEPGLIHIGEGKFPSLRLSYDAYLSWFQGRGFCISCDAYGNGSHGTSTANLRTTKRIMDVYKEIAEQSGKPMDEVFCKLMFLSYPLEAASDYQTFYKLLRDRPEVADIFFDETDDRVFHYDLDKELTLKVLCNMLESGSKFDECLLVPQQFVLVDEYNKVGSRAYATLSFHDVGVELRWISPRGPKCWSVMLPEWEEEYFRDTSGTCESVMCRSHVISKRTWMYTCWHRLSIAMLCLSGIILAHKWSRPFWSSSFVTFDERLFPKATYIHGRRDLVAALDELCDKYLDHKVELGIKA